jgi:hypothetical protein
VKRPRAWGALAALLLSAACHRDALSRLERDPSVLAVVGRYLVTREDLASALAYSQTANAQDDAVKSRVLDSLISSLLALNDAAVDEAPAAPIPLGALSDPKVREELVASILQERVYSQVTVSKQEIQRYYRDHASDYLRGPGVLLRQMLLPGLPQARDAERLLSERHSFVDVARLYSLSPDRGATQYFEYSEIPDYLRSAAAQARIGVPTRPIPVTADTWQILLVEKRFERYDLPLEEVEPEIRLRLTDEMGDRLYREYLAGLRERFPVVVFWAKLPFAYVKETP